MGNNGALMYGALQKNMIGVLRIFSVGCIPLIQTLFLTLAFYYPWFFLWFALAGIIITDLGIAFLIQEHTKKGELFVTSIPSLALIVAVSGIILFVEDQRLITLLITGNGIIQLVYFINLYLHSFKKFNYHQRLLAHISNACNTLSVYLLSSCIFAIIYYFDIHLWKMLVFLLLIPILFYSITLKVYNLGIKLQLQNIFFIALLAVEIVVVVHWNSFPWYVASLIYTVFYSTYEQLSISQKIGELTHSKVLVHFIVLVSVIVLSIFTIL